MYLAGAGIGTIGLADGDVVEVSNLHRQIAHSTEKVGMLKVDSAISFLKRYLPPAAHYLPDHTHPSLRKLLTHLVSTQPTPTTPTAPT